VAPVGRVAAALPAFEKCGGRPRKWPLAEASAREGATRKRFGGAPGARPPPKRSNPPKRVRDTHSRSATPGRRPPVVVAAAVVVVVVVITVGTVAAVIFVAATLGPVALVTFVTATLGPVAAVTLVAAALAAVPVLTPVAVVLDARPGVASGSLGAALGCVSTVLFDAGSGPATGALGAGLGTARGVALAVVLAVGLDASRMAGAGTLGAGIGVVSGLDTGFMGAAGSVATGLLAIGAVGLGAVALDALTVEVTAPLGAIVGVVLTVSGDALLDGAAGHVAAPVLAGRRLVWTVTLGAVALGTVTLGTVTLGTVALAMLGDALADPVPSPLDTAVGVLLAVLLDAFSGHLATRMAAAVLAIRSLAVTLGTVTLGTVALGTVALGTVTLGTITLGTVTLGTVTFGTVTLGTVTLGAVGFLAFGGEAASVSDTALLLTAVFDARPRRMSSPGMTGVLAGRRRFRLIRRPGAQFVDLVVQRRVRALLLTRCKPQRQEQRQRPHESAMKMHRIPPSSSSWMNGIATIVPALKPQTSVHEMTSARDTLGPLSTDHDNRHGSSNVTISCARASPRGVFTPAVSCNGTPARSGNRASSSSPPSSSTRTRRALGYSHPSGSMVSSQS
jgi:hypothetical protein